MPALGDVSANAVEWRCGLSIKTVLIYSAPIASWGFHAIKIFAKLFVIGRKIIAVIIMTGQLYYHDN